MRRRHFHGPSLDILPPPLLESGLKFFEERIAFKDKITGETGIDGLMIDFNDGLRLQIPKGDWHVRISDGDMIFFDEDASEVTLISMEKFFIEWEIAIWLDGEPVFYHRFDPSGQTVHFVFRQAMGDNIALFPYVEQFRRTFDCRATCTVPLELTGKTVLNSPLIRRPSKVIYTPTKPRSIEQKYVCIAVQASGTHKCWLNPGGWDQVVDDLKSNGYRVLCMDRDRQCSGNGLTVEMPAGAEDFTGDIPLLERINVLAYADFFIGLGSGLSWLAWSVDIPVVLISGFSEPCYEFDTPYRIQNPMVCHGCFNDMRVDFSRVAACVSYADAARKYECSKKISARSVIEAIDRLMVDNNLDGRNQFDSGD